MPATQRDVGAQLRARAAASTFAPQRCVNDKSPRAATIPADSLQRLKADTLSPTGAQLLHEGHKLAMVSKHCACPEFSLHFTAGLTGKKKILRCDFRLVIYRQPKELCALAEDWGSYFTTG